MFGANIDCLLEGDKALADGNKDLAIKYYKQAILRLQPKEVKFALMKLGNAYYLFGQYASALNTYTSLLADVYVEDKESKKCLLSMGQCYARNKRFQTAIDTYLRALITGSKNESNETNVLIHFYLGDACYRYAKYEHDANYFAHAIKHLSIAIRELELDQPQDENKLARAYMTLGDAYFSCPNYNPTNKVVPPAYWILKNHNKALKYYEQAIMLNKKLKGGALSPKGESLAHLNSAEIHILRAKNAENKSEHYEKAIASYTALSQCSDDEILTYSRRANAHYLLAEATQLHTAHLKNAMEDYTKAIEACINKVNTAEVDKKAKSEKELPKLYMARANIHVALKDNQRALADYMKALLKNGQCINRLTNTMMALKLSMGEKDFADFFFAMLAREFSSEEQKQFLDDCCYAKSSTASIFIRKYISLRNFFNGNGKLFFEKIEKARDDLEKKQSVSNYINAVLKKENAIALNVNFLLNLLQTLKQEAFTDFLLRTLTKQFRLSDQQEFLQYCLDVHLGKKPNPALCTLLKNNHFLLEKIQISYTELILQDILPHYIKRLVSNDQVNEKSKLGLLIASAMEPVMPHIGKEAFSRFFFGMLLKEVSSEDTKKFFDLCLKINSNQDNSYPHLKKFFDKDTGQYLFEKIKQAVKLNYPELINASQKTDVLKVGEFFYSTNSLFYTKLKDKTRRENKTFYTRLDGDDYDEDEVKVQTPSLRSSQK